MDGSIGKMIKETQLTYLEVNRVNNICERDLSNLVLLMHLYKYNIAIFIAYR